MAAEERRRRRLLSILRAPILRQRGGCSGQVVEALRLVPLRYCDEQQTLWTAYSATV